jgi:AraC-like DNA-binding protein
VGVSSQLHLQTLQLVPGEEWALPSACWTLARIHSGEAYLLGTPAPVGCSPGSVVVSGGGAPLTLRSSQLGGSVIQWFQFSTASLFGVLTLPERNRLEHPERISPELPWVHGAGSDLGRRFSNLVAARVTRPLEERGCLLEIVSTALLGGLDAPGGPLKARPDAGDRLEELVYQLTDSELFSLSAERLAELCRCEKRRLLLLFRERFGGSLPGQQGEWRRVRAVSLLAQPGVSVSSVARSCGYEDPDAFRAWFRRQFGKAPAQWKRDLVTEQTDSPAVHPRHPDHGPVTGVSPVLAKPGA